MTNLSSRCLLRSSRVPGYLVIGAVHVITLLARCARAHVLVRTRYEHVGEALRVADGCYTTGGLRDIIGYDL